VSVQRYKLKVRIVEAIQYSGANADEILAWCPVAEKSGDNIKLNFPVGSVAEDVIIKPNDWIFGTSKGHFAPGRAQDHGYVPFSDMWESVL
jgi:hypothetical protein